MQDTVQSTVDEVDGLLDAFEGQVDDDDITESLSSEELFTRVLTDDNLEKTVTEATITRITVGESEFDRDIQVCKIYYELGGMEWITEADPRRADERGRLKSLFNRYDVSLYSPADIVGRKVTAIVTKRGPRLVIESDLDTHADVQRAWASNRYVYNNTFEKMAPRPRDSGLVLSGLTIVAALITVITSTTGAGLLVFLLGMFAAWFSAFFLHWAMPFSIRVKTTWNDKPRPQG